jgi:hypothetical protein
MVLGGGGAHLSDFFPPQEAYKIEDDPRRPKGRRLRITAQWQTPFRVDFSFQGATGKPNSSSPLAPPPDPAAASAAGSEAATGAAGGARSPIPLSGRF